MMETINSGSGLAMSRKASSMLLRMGSSISLKHQDSLQCLHPFTQLTHLQIPSQKETLS
jgi:hypothetical protein